MSKGSKRIRFAAIGECMIELSHQNPMQLNLGFAGDTLNTATYLARYSQILSLQVEYVTAVGNDPYSDKMLAAWHQDNISTHFVTRIADKLPGLYLIQTNEQGERFFYFYRDQSAARKLFYTENIQQICAELENFDYLYFSGISLAILDEASRDKLFVLITRAKKNGAKICFDTNYRPKLWANKAIAQEVMQRFISKVDIMLTTFTDEQQLFSEQTEVETIARLKTLGVQETVLKRDKQPCLIALANGQEFSVAAKLVTNVTDTTAAGDSFNAAYLAARINDLSPKQAAECGHQLAAKVIQYKGAIIPQQAMPELFQNPD